VAIGAITFTGSVIALDGRMSGKPIMLPQRHAINIGLAVACSSCSSCHPRRRPLHVLAHRAGLVALGVLLIIPIGGADMPVVVSMLNSYSGWAAAGIGFTLANLALIITGALVGSSGAILSYIMCKGMNRGFFSVILGGFGGETAGPSGGAVEQRPIKQGSADDRRVPDEECRQGHHRAGLRHGGGPGAAALADNEWRLLVLPQINASTINCAPDIVGDAGGIAP
jgi:proton-translocating NAD(P)+ transhydrogenase subunit beta